MRTVINVSNRLPVTVGETLTKSSGGLVSAMDELKQIYDFKWVGWAGDVTGNSTNKKQIAAELKALFNYWPVFLTKQEVTDYYNGFSNSSMWPLLHYMTTHAKYEERWFEQYRRVNHIFADAVLDTVRKGDNVWIHDYHLMLLPAILRKQKPSLKIGFFLHTPFPSYEVFRCHPNRAEIVEGMLGADLIGFHTFGYLRHFRSSVLRILGIESEMNRIPGTSHDAFIGVYPIGINTDKFSRELSSDAYRKSLNDLKKAHSGKKIVLSVERMDYSKGIPRRLDAIERYLKADGLRDDIVFIFISVPTRESVREYRELRRQVEQKVSKINGRYSSTKNVPVHFIYRSIDFSELCALYAIADVALVTPLIDGMNLVAKEYLFCQQDKHGVLILSEFAGAAQELSHASIVNPYNIGDMVQSLREAFNLPEEERRMRLELMKQRVTQHNARFWAGSFIRDLSATLPQKTASVVAEDFEAAVRKKIVPQKRVAIFLNYDGTLSELKPKPSDAVPDEEVDGILRKISEVGNVETYLISGRKKEDMDRWFSKYHLNLIAEHGYYYRTSNSAEWIVFNPNADLSWKSQINDIFRRYAETIPGSFVEEKTSSVVWHYRRTDPELGTIKANQLVSELYEMLSNLPLEIHHGKKIVEVNSTKINKGIIMEYFISQNNYEAVLCAGDDETDENMFRMTNDRIVSVKVGNGNTDASYQLPNPRALRSFIEKLLRWRRGENV